MTTAQMRDALLRTPKYRSSSSWAAKVQRMPDYQVIAIYLRFERDGVFNQLAERPFNAKGGK